MSDPTNKPESVSPENIKSVASESISAPHEGQTSQAGQAAHSKQTQPLKYVNRLIIVGLLLSALLEYVHAKTFLVPAADSFCSVSERFDCAAVASSQFSVFLGLPWAVWGLLGFLSMLIASLRRSIWLWPLSVCSASVSLFLLWVSLFSIGSLCYLCEATHLVSWLLVILIARGRRALTGRYGDWNEMTAIFAAPLGTLLALLAFVPNYWSVFTYRGEPPYPTGTTEDNLPWIGAIEPKVVLHEYIDYGCPHCRAQSARTLRSLASHPELRVVRRQQPRMHCEKTAETSCQYARMALCAQDQGKFWQADRWLFAYVDVHKEPDLEGMARDLKLQRDEFLSCFASDEVFKRASAEAKAATRGGIRFVPGHKVDGKRLKPDEVRKLLD